jgi:hypothetical protein
MFQAWNMEDLTPHGRGTAAAPPISHQASTSQATTTILARDG